MEPKKSKEQITVYVYIYIYSYSPAIIMPDLLAHLLMDRLLLVQTVLYFPGYLVCVVSYIYLQVLPLVFGSLASIIRPIVSLSFIVLEAHDSWDVEEYAKKSD